MEGHLRAKEALMGPPASLPYQERSGHHLAYRTKKPQHDKTQIQKGAVTTGHIGRQNQKKKADVVRAHN